MVLPHELIKKVLRRIKKRFFAKRFKEFHPSSACGTDGCGRNCVLGKPEYISIGENTYLGQDCELISLDKHFSQKLHPDLKIGNHVRATARLRITCAGNIVIEDDVLIAPDVFITDHNHGMDPTCLRGYSPQPLIVKDVTIKAGVWIGQKACILPGVTVGAHSIIGAGSIVTHDIPDFCIAGGVPAEVIKKWNFEKKEWGRA
jgi:lipopolysaccharide O-acetyltransferase